MDDQFVVVGFGNHLGETRPILKEKLLTVERTARKLTFKPPKVSLRALPPAPKSTFLPLMNHLRTKESIELYLRSDMANFNKLKEISILLSDRRLALQEEKSSLQISQIFTKQRDFEMQTGCREGQAETYVRRYGNLALETYTKHRSLIKRLAIQLGIPENSAQEILEQSDYKFQGF